MMKKSAFLCIAVLLLYLPCHARDYVVEFVQENYKETQSVFSYAPVVYHSIQVNSEVGPKLLMLTGDDYHYRTWVREYIAEGKAFIVKVPDEQNGLFLSSKVFEIDVRMIHPFNIGQFREAEQKEETPLPAEPMLEKKPAQTGSNAARPAPEQPSSESGRGALKVQEKPVS